ncbi:MAG TPA: RsiV family protein [Rhodanobacteraceae bacterium]|nr:RsiV family protein [Rhodanobacteraceae bacterium]
MKPLASIRPIRLVPALALALAACGQQPAPDTAAAAGSVADTSATAIAAPPTSTNSRKLPGDHAVTRHYRISVTLPTLPADEQPLADALRTTADNGKREFLEALPDPTQFPEFAGRRFELLLKFRVAANTRAFTSVRETGLQDTGGAHPAPVEAAFVFDRHARKLVTLDDLFAEPDGARKALANFARDTLLKRFMANAPEPGDGSSAQAIRGWKSGMLQMLNDGTQPTTVNYSLFVVRAGEDEDAPSPGITLVFPPYQVAAYVYGRQTVEVPAAVFAKFLKPQYRSDFAAE